MNSWSWRSLREVTIPGSNWKPRLDPRSAIRYIDVSAVSRDELRVVSEATHSSEDAPSRARKIVKSGDTIFATVRPALKRIAQIPASLDGEIVSTAFCVLRPNPRVIHPDFLYFAMQLEPVVDSITNLQSGASYPAVRDVDVLKQAVPLPPLQTQYKIAAALNLVRTSILHQSQCARTATILKRATMQQLFTRGLRGEAQKETEIGPMPESWGIYPLRSLCIEAGAVDLRREGEREVEYVDVSSVSREFLRIESTSRFALRSGPSRARKRINAGDVIFATVRPTLLRVAIVPTKLDNQVCSTAFCVLRRAQDKTAERFIYYIVQREQFVQQLGSLESGASYPAVTDRTVNDQLAPVPSIDEQREIVSILDAIDRKIDLHRRKRAVLDELFKALLHKLMTGEICVSDLDLPTYPRVDAETVFTKACFNAS